MTQLSDQLALPGRMPTSVVLNRAVKALPLTDSLSVASGFAVAHLVRFGEDTGTLLVGPIELDYWVVGCASAVVWSAALYAFRPRSSLAFARSDEDYRSAVRASLLVFTLFSFVALAFQLEPSRAYLLYAFPAGTAAVVASRYLWRRAVRRARSTAAGTKAVLVIGTREEASRFAAGLDTSAGTGLRTVEVCVTDGDASPPSAASAQSDREWLDSIRDRIDESGAEVVVVGSLPPDRQVSVRTLAWNLEESGAQLLLAPKLQSVTTSRLSVLEVAGTPVIFVEQPRFSGEKYVCKRVLDLVLASASLVVAIPVTAFAAAAIYLADGSAPFFRQQRVGVGGRAFTLYKLRTMRVGAHTATAELSAANEASGPLFKMRADPRVTPIGTFLRRYSIDELPQLLNVLRGEMSIVGPRPPLPSETEEYEASARRRLLVKPGLTGPWQVGGRSDLAWEDGLSLDLGYVENWSVLGDLTIIAKTVRAVLHHRGAY